jgi:hypothetical protein
MQKDELKDLLANNQIDSVIDNLNVIIKCGLAHDALSKSLKDMQNVLVSKSAEYHSIKRNHLLGLIDADTFGRNCCRITDGMTMIIDQVLEMPEVKSIEQAVIEKEMKVFRKKSATIENQPFLKIMFFICLLVTVCVNLLSLWYLRGESKTIEKQTNQTEAKYGMTTRTYYVNSDSLHEEILYDKTFVFWIPSFKNALQTVELANSKDVEKDFNKTLLMKFSGFTRWNVSGNYSEGGFTEPEEGWFYQVSLKRDKMNISIRDIQKIISPYFKQRNWYITEVKHQ